MGDDGAAAVAEEAEAEPEAGGSLPEKQEAASRGTSGREAARTAQLDAKPEDGAKEAAAEKVVADKDTEV